MIQSTHPRSLSYKRGMTAGFSCDEFKSSCFSLFPFFFQEKGLGDELKKEK